MESYDIIGPIKGNVPRALPAKRCGHPFNLDNRDIVGSTPRRWIGCLPTDKSHTRDHLSVADIVGCQADSIKRVKGRKGREGNGRTFLYDNHQVRVGRR